MEYPWQVGKTHVGPLGWAGVVYGGQMLVPTGAEVSVVPPTFRSVTETVLFLNFPWATVCSSTVTGIGALGALQIQLVTW